MSPNHCCIPGCSESRYKNKKNSSNCTFFTILRPDMAKSEEEKQHRQYLTNFLLSMRDAAKGDKIKTMLHKET